MESFEIGVNISLEVVQELLQKRLVLLLQIYPELEFCGIYSSAESESINEIITQFSANMTAIEYLVFVDRKTANCNWSIKNNESYECISSSEISFCSTETDSICISECLLLTKGKSDSYLNVYLFFTC